jgi:hypothetical protein
VDAPGLALVLTRVLVSTHRQVGFPVASILCELPLNAPVPLAVLARHERDGEELQPPPGPHATQHFVWESRFGSIVVDVIGDQTFVNGELVEPAQL